MKSSIDNPWKTWFSYDMADTKVFPHVGTLQQRQRRRTGYNSVRMQNYATDKDSRRSMSGMAVFIAGNFIYGDSSRQHRTTNSSTAAEIYAASKATMAICGDQELMKILGHEVFRPATIYIDSSSALQNFNDIDTKTALKHQAIDIAICRDGKLYGNTTYAKIHTTENIADMMTKALPGPQHAYLRDHFMEDCTRFYESN